MKKITSQKYEQIFKLFIGANLLSDKERRRVFRGLSLIVDQMGIDVTQWSSQAVRDLYIQGTEEAIKQLVENNLKVSVTYNFQKIHRQSMEALIDETDNFLAQALQGVTKTGKLIVSQATLKKIFETVARGQITGASIREMRKEIEARLKKDGLTAVISKNGNKLDLRNYAETLARTEMTKAYNTGHINRMMESGQDLVQVSDHHRECQLCRPWENRILSITGKTKGYPTVDEAEKAGLLHPNCRHSMTPIKMNNFLRNSKVWDTRKQKFVEFGSYAQDKQDLKALLEKNDDIMSEI